MDVLLQRHEAKLIYKIPEGLNELMSDISREVLRAQPKEIYCFIADYLDSLFITRMNALVAERVIDSVSEAAEAIVNVVQETHKSKETIERTAIVIQRAFRSFIHRKQDHDNKEADEEYEDEDLKAGLLEELGCDFEQASAAAKIIQKSFRTFKLKKEEEYSLMGIIDWKAAVKKTIALFKKARPSQEELIRAANLIKAAYKGYYTRRVLQFEKEEKQERRKPRQSIVATNLLDLQKISSSLLCLDHPPYCDRHVFLSDRLSLIDSDTDNETKRICKLILEEILDVVENQYPTRRASSAVDEIVSSASESILLTIKDHDPDDYVSAIVNIFDDFDHTASTDFQSLEVSTGLLDVTGIVKDVNNVNEDKDIAESSMFFDVTSEGTTLDLDGLFHNQDLNASEGGERPTWADEEGMNLTANVEQITSDKQQSTSLENFSNLILDRKKLSIILEGEG